MTVQGGCREEGQNEKYQEIASKDGGKLRGKKQVHWAQLTTWGATRVKREKTSGILTGKKWEKKGNGEATQGNARRNENGGKNAAPVTLKRVYEMARVV